MSITDKSPEEVAKILLEYSKKYSNNAMLLIDRHVRLSQTVLGIDPSMVFHLIISCMETDRDATTSTVIFLNYMMEKEPEVLKKLMAETRADFEKLLKREASIIKSMPICQN